MKVFKLETAIVRNVDTNDPRTSYEKYVQGKSILRYYLGLIYRWWIHRRYEKIANIARKNGAKVGSNVYMTKAFAQNCTNKTVIGDNVVIDANVLIGARNPLVIGNNVIIGKDVKFFLSGHNINSPSWESYRKRGGLVIEDYVWICPYSIIMPRVEYIKMGAVINTGSVLNENVSAMQIMMGNPANNVGIRKCVHSELVVESLMNNDYQRYKEARKKRRD